LPFTVSSATEAIEYDAFGNIISGELSSPFMYCGEYRDDETGLYYLRARYYDPLIGRMISEDPARSGLNWYVYCLGNPVRFIDPLGLFDHDTVLSYENNKGVYNDDVKVLQYFLYQKGYYTPPWYPGEGYGWGYFDQDLAAAITIWKNNTSLGSGKDVDFSGTVDLSWWIKTGGIYRTECDRNAGVAISTIGFSQYYDISVPVANALARDIWMFRDRNGGKFVATNFWFAGMVGDEGAWNLKANRGATWTNTLGISFWGYNTQMILNGSFVYVEDVGNITYGYLGSAIGFSQSWLNTWSAANHFKNHGFTQWANERDDQANIAIGVNWFYSK